MISMTWPQYLRSECSVRHPLGKIKLKLSPRSADVLLCFLLRKGKGSTSINDLVEFLWPDDDEPQTSVVSVKVAIHNLRRDFGFYNVLVNRYNFGYSLNTTKSFWEVTDDKRRVYKKNPRRIKGYYAINRNFKRSKYDFVNGINNTCQNRFQDIEF